MLRSSLIKDLDYEEAVEVESSNELDYGAF